MSLIALAIIAFMLYQGAGWPAVIVFAAVLLWAWGVLLPMHIKLSYIRARPEGLEIRNLLGIRRSVSRDRIASVAVGTAWAGGLRVPDFAFIVSPTGGRIARLNLVLWEVEDLGRVANALSLPLYGRPGRRLDKFHSAKSAERAAQVLLSSLVFGIVIGIALPIILLVGLIAWAVVTVHH